MKLLFKSLIFSLVFLINGCAGFSDWVLLPTKKYNGGKYVTNLKECDDFARNYFKSNKEIPKKKIKLLVGDRNLDSLSPFESNASNEFNQLYSICLIERGFEFAEVPVNTTGSETLCDTYHRYKRGKVNMDTLNNWCQIRLGVDECTKCIARKQ